MNGDLQLELTSIESKPWESSFFNADVFYVDTRLDPTRKKFYYTLVDSADVEKINHLEEIGYRVLIPTVTLEISNEKIGKTPLIANSNIRVANDGDLRPLQYIAGVSFNKTRLHSSIGISIADDMHEDWIKNCLNKTQADEVLVYQGIEEIIGFIATRVRGDTGEIILIAVAPRVRNQSIGKTLTMLSCQNMYDRVEKVIVRTELPNISAIRMYEGCGFKMVNGSVYLGKWV